MASSDIPDAHETIEGVIEHSTFELTSLMHAVDMVGYPIAASTDKLLDFADALEDAADSVRRAIAKRRGVDL